MYEHEKHKYDCPFDTKIKFYNGLYFYFIFFLNVLIVKNKKFPLW